MKRPVYVILSAAFSLLLHLLVLALADRVQLRTAIFTTPPFQPPVTVRTVPVDQLVMEKPRIRQDLLRQAEELLSQAVEAAPRIHHVFEQEMTDITPPKPTVRLRGLGDNLLKPNAADPPKATMPTAPPPRILEIDADTLPLERLAMAPRLQPKIERFDIPQRDLPSLLPPGPLQGGVGQTFDVSMRLGPLPGVPGLRQSDLEGLEAAETGRGGAERPLAPREGIPGLGELAEAGVLTRNSLGQDPLDSLDEFVNVSVVVHWDPRGGGYFRADIAANPRSEALRDVPKDILLVIDHSTSISERQLEQFKAGTVEALQYLNPKDRFDVISFTDSPRRCFGELTPVAPESLARAATYVKGLMRGGMTDVFGGLSPFVSQNNPDALRPLNVFLMSDGNSTVNIRKDDDFVRGIVGMNPGNVSIYSFSAGRKANLFLMRFLGYLNRGFSLHEDEVGNFRRRLVSFISGHSSLIVADLRYEAAGGLGGGIFPKRLPHLYRGETLSIFGQFPPSADELVLSLIGRDGTGKRRELVFRRRFKECPEGGGDLAQNWAAQKVFHLIGERTLSTDEERRAAISEEISNLARQFALYVPY